MDYHGNIDSLCTFPVLIQAQHPRAFPFNWMSFCKEKRKPEACNCSSDKFLSGCASHQSPETSGDEKSKQTKLHGDEEENVCLLYTYLLMQRQVYRHLNRLLQLAHLLLFSLMWSGCELRFDHAKKLFFFQCCELFKAKATVLNEFNLHHIFVGV